MNRQVAQAASDATTTATPDPASNGQGNGAKNTQAACDLLTADYKSFLEAQARATDLDLIDLSASLSDKSVYQQVLDQDVGSHDISDALRSTFLTLVAEKLIEEIVSYAKNPSNAPLLDGQPTAKSLQDTITGCLSSTSSLSSMFGCVNGIATIQQSISVAQSNRAACNFARSAWLPTFTAIHLRVRKLTSNLDQRYTVKSSILLRERRTSIRPPTAA